MGTICQIGGKNYSLTRRNIDSNCQQDIFKRSDLGVTECAAHLVEKDVDVH